MAERRLQSSSFGHPGRPTYSNFGDEQAEEWGWQYARNHDPTAPRFESITPAQEWFSGSNHVDALPAGRNWHVAQQQKKWLMKNHPEAALGNDILGDMLAPEISGRNTSERASCQSTQLAIGEMADMRSATAVHGVPLIAMAAGSASDVLRFVRPKLEGWAPNGNGATLLHLLGPKEPPEASWTQETGAILRIKAVVSLRRFDPVRWLLVQRHTGTSVFRPEYQKAPVDPEALQENRSYAPAHVNPNLLFTVPKRLTGCDSHSDVSFNPGIKSQPPQLAIIDEGGRWTVWDVNGLRSRINRRPKKHLVKCGSIRKGVRNSIAHRSSAEPRWHRICWIGSLVDELNDDSDGEESSDEQAQPAYPPLERSSTLLLCNRETLRILDLDSDTFLPDLPLLAEGSGNCILDIHVDSGDPRYFFVITTTTLYVCGLFSANDPPSSSRVVKKALILHYTLHIRDAILRDLRLAVSPGPCSTNERTSLVHLYSRSSNWVDVFCVTKLRTSPERIMCHRDMMGKKLRLQTVCLSPVLAAPRPNTILTFEDRLFANLTRRYYQIFSLGTDLSLHCALGLSSGSKSTPRPLPVEGADDLIPKNQRQRTIIRSLAERFLVPDALEVFRYRIEGLQIAAGNDLRPPPPRDMIRRHVKQFHEILRQTSLDLLHMHDSKDVDMDIYGAAPFDPVYVTAQEATEARKLPLKTLLQIVQDVKLPADLEDASREWQAEIEGLSGTDPGLQVTSIARPRKAATQEQNRSLLDIFSELSSFVEGRNPYSIEHGMTPIVMRIMACESFLSLFGMMFRDIAAFEVSEPASQDIRSSPAPGESMILSSQMSSRSATPMSSAPAEQVQSESVDGEDRAMALIRAYTGSGKTTPPKPAQRTSTWVVGNNPTDHVWSVDINTEVTEGMMRRARQQNKQATKRKRGEALLRLEWEAEQERKRKAKSFRSTQPVPETKFFSSQASQPLQEFSLPPNAVVRPSAVSMSQPLPGAFGGRSGNDRPKKKQKRKGGF
ncbi:hypothetical protein PG994_001300 [Apiospora phragmitis]|uniref:RNA polymerase I-specific transcription initiation factor RRN6-like protein n=1 Tax=Apiospora phragmitis TaxID=2905665 RepID=A0ABR1WT47_9PEZI